jgi:hypothetical protein
MSLLLGAFKVAHAPIAADWPQYPSESTPEFGDCATCPPILALWMIPVGYTQFLAMNAQRLICQTSLLLRELKIGHLHAVYECANASNNQVAIVSARRYNRRASRMTRNANVECPQPLLNCVLPDGNTYIATNLAFQNKFLTKQWASQTVIDGGVGKPCCA